MLTREEFIKLRDLHRTQKKINKGIEEIFNEILPQLANHIQLSDPIEIEIHISPDGNISTSSVNRSGQSHISVGSRIVSDDIFVGVLEPALRDLGKKILNFVRKELHPSGRLVKSKYTNRYTNYEIKNGKVYRKDNMNFVSLINQKEAIKINILKGDYLPFTHIEIDYKEPRYYSFKLSDSYQLQDAYDAIEISYYHYHNNPTDLYFDDE